MYHLPNHPFSHNNKEHSNLFSSTQDINLLRNQSAVTSLPVVPASLEPQTADTSGSQGIRKRKEKSAKTKSAGKVVDTSQFTVEQRVVAAVWVHERLHTRTSMGQIKQQFLARFGRPAPARNTLLAWERKLFSRGAVHDAPRAGRPARRQLLAGAVRASLAAAPALSLRARAAALRVPRSTLRALLRAAPPPAAKKTPAGDGATAAEPLHCLPSASTCRPGLATRACE